MTVDELANRLGGPAAIGSRESHPGRDLAHRIDSSHRRHSPGDLVALDRMRNQVAATRITAIAAAMVNAGLTASTTQLCTTLLAAAHHLDATEITDVLGQSVWLHGVPTTIDDVVLPALREIGARWSRGECDVAQEQVATTTIQRWLLTLSQRARTPPPGAAVLLSCGPAEQHTLGLAALAVLLAHHGVACINLGALTPATAVRAAILNAEVSAVVLTSQLNSNRPATIAALRTVSDTSAVLYYAGAAFRAAFRTAASRRGVPGTYLGGSLTKAAAHLANQQTP